MKRVVLVLAILTLAVCAFAVSGKVFMRYGMYNMLDSTGAPKIGPMWSYWGDPYNTDLWQNQPGGTGFSVNFDSFGLLWKTREKLPTTYTTPDGTFDTCLKALYANGNGAYAASDRWGADTAEIGATSPGYFQINNLKIGQIVLQAGLAWWNIHASDKYFGTNDTFGAYTAGTNVDSLAKIDFDKFYLDFKFIIPIAGDTIVLKIVDWDLLWTEFYFGSSSITGKFANSPNWGGWPSNILPAGSITSNANSVNGFKVYVPLRFLVNLDAISLDIGPKVIYDTSSSVTKTMTTTNTTANNFLKIGVYARANVGLTDMLAVYASAGYFYENETIFSTTNNSTLTNQDIVNTHNIIPLFAGLKIKLAPGISMNLGYGAQLYLASEDVNYGPGRATTNKIIYGMIARTGYMKNWESSQAVGPVEGTTMIAARMINAERQTYGDSIMDNSFIKFGGEATFAQSWTLGLAGAVSLNDGWTYNWYNDGSFNQTQVYQNGASSVSRTVFNMLAFQNFMNYDNNMYIKYEDDKVAIKATFAMFPLDVEATTGVGSRQNAVANLFSYLDFTVKF